MKPVFARLIRPNSWQPDDYYLGDSISLASTGVTLALEELYYQVDNEDMHQQELES